MQNNELYNKKTIERLCHNIIITDTQRNAANRWIELLEKNLLKDEKKAYIEFASTILRDLLNYDIGIESLQHESGYMEFPFLNVDNSYAVLFEVKGTKTKNLFGRQYREKVGFETPVSQTWTKMSEFVIPYGVCTNYKIFILFDYSKGFSKYYKFDFTEIKNNDNKLREFIAIFARENIIEYKFLEKLYNESILEEKNFSNEFYKIFHETRLMLIQEFKEYGIKNEDAIKYTQLFLNRMIFIFFAESTGKMPKRIFQEDILKILGTVMIFSEDTTLIYDIIINIFKKLDIGSDQPIKIFGFNGELFREEFPKELSFKDLRSERYFNKIYLHSKFKNRPELDIKTKKLLKLHGGGLNPIIKNILIMGSFDFKSEVNVNILGHIFEQSISDIEDLKGEKQIRRRKKEGIYYTPEFITEYICRNTIIPFLSNRGVNTVRELINENSENIDELINKINNIKILDPACGSGAFLLKAIDVLLEIKEEIIEFKNIKGDYVTELDKGRLSKREKGQKPLKFESFEKFNEIEETKEIIKKNIFGVDLNEESVEITKLSIFFKICRKNEKLLNLREIIKCGNSLIDDYNLAGIQAFSWEKNFLEKLDGGKFDIIIGNPPWGAEFDELSLNYLKEKYSKVSRRTINSFKMFIQRALSLLSPNGAFGFILPNGIIEMPDYSDVRELIFSFSKKLKIIDLGDDIFENVNYPSSIITFPNNILNSDIILIKDLKLLERNELSTFELEKDNFFELKVEELDNKYRFKYDELKFLKDFTIPMRNKYFVIFGVKVYQVGKGISKIKSNSKQIAKDKVQNVYLSSRKTKEHVNKFLVGKNICKFIYLWKENIDDCYINYGKHLAEPRSRLFFKKEKIVVQQIVNKTISAALVDEDMIVKNTCALINQQNREYSLLYLLGLLNSKFLVYIHLKRSANATKRSFPKLNSNDIKNFPIPIIDSININLVIQLENNTRKILKEEEVYKKDLDNFIDYLKINYDIDLTDLYFKLNQSIQKGKDEFSKLLIKNRLELEKGDIFDHMMRYYEKLGKFHKLVDNIINENDKLVYKLYNIPDSMINEIKKVIQYY